MCITLTQPSAFEAKNVMGLGESILAISFYVGLLICIKDICNVFNPVPCRHPAELVLL